MERRLRRLVPIAAFILAGAGCAHRSDLQRPATQSNYGVEMARMNLWREAMFRFQRALAANPTDARVHNNLAVAYEANGDFEKARVQYLEALRLDRTNEYIQKNYSRCVEFLSRNRKRTQGKSGGASQLPPSNPAGARGGVTSSDPPARPETAGPQPKPTPPPTNPPSDLPPPPPAPAPVPPPVGSGGGR